MNLLPGILANQPILTLIVVLMAASVLLSTIGRRFLTGWLGLTDKSASRITSVTMLVFWTAITLIALGLRGGGWDSRQTLGGLFELLGSSGWIILLVILSVLWRTLRR